MNGKNFAPPSATAKVGRRSHGGVYRKTEDISTSAAASIKKWRFAVEIQRQTACVKFTRDERTFYWHPVAKKFRREGEASWSHLPSGRGVVALMLHLHGKEELYGIPHFGAMCDPPIRRPGDPVAGHMTNTDNPIDFPKHAIVCPGDTIDHPVMSSAAAKHGVMQSASQDAYASAAGSARASTGGATGEATGEPESHTVGHARAENFAPAPPKERKPFDVCTLGTPRYFLDEQEVMDREGGQQ